ncbi:MAG TPA: HEAT repeat domain-containing protein, partial [Gemmataceae bacterium]|nr:HEAT repeat domain-containing protein [Gemmataceae bacterium]
MHRCSVLVVAILFAAVPAAHAQRKKKSDRAAPAPTREQLQRDIRPAAEFNATVYASPPNVSYPTCLCAGPDGSLFVGIDKTGSLGLQKKMGSVVRCIDTKGDGIADKFQTFCEVDHPRGLFFHAGKLIVLNPPFLTAFYDDDGDGKADRSEILIKGISTEMNEKRGADHTTNGFRLGIDGWLYIAVGDFGFTKAVGKDGKSLTMHGGGVVRVRPDGTELEIVSQGQRNIYDVAVSPLLEIFTRDNTNDGDGWDSRLSHVVPLAHFGYPSLFVHFGDEIVQPLADYGGGAATGALWVSEPNLPKGFGDTLYTVDWGRSAVYRHLLEKNGATYKDKLVQKEFVHIPSPTDIDVDGSGRIYVSSWRGGSFNYGGPNIGFIARLTPKNWKYEPMPDMKDARVGKLPAPLLTAPSRAGELLKQLLSPSHYRRQYAQLELLKLPTTDRNQALLLIGIVDKSASLESRVAAMFTYKQLFKADSVAFIQKLADSPELREYSIRAVTDRVGEAAAVKTEWLVGFLGDSDPRVRLQAIIALARLDRKEAAAKIVPLTSDSDILVKHIAVRALMKLKAADACLASVDAGKDLVGSLRVLQSIHEPAVSDALIARYKKATSAEQQQALLPALCRLYFEEGPWNGSWWGTRPDTTGPYFNRVKWSQSVKIGETLKEALDHVDSPTQRLLLVELRKHRIDLPGADALLVKLAGQDPSFRAQAVALLGGATTLPSEALDLFRQAATSGEPAVQVKALRGLQRFMGQKGFLEPTIATFAALTSKDLGHKDVAAAWEDFVRDGKHGQHVAAFAKLVDDGDPGRRDLGLAVLLHLATGKLTKAKARAAAQSRIDRMWTEADRIVPLVDMVKKTKTDQYAFQLKGLLADARPEVKKAAESAWKSLGLDRTEGKNRVILKGQAYEKVYGEAMKLPGDAKLGASLFLKQGCIACHTVSPTEPPKGPYLGDIAVRYKRPDFIESILKPSAKIAQGFETNFFVQSNGKVTEGFIVRESGDEVELRTSAGIVQVLNKSDIE